ncbi:MAG: ABC transporter ATP-binding protein [Lachnospiraceae bacterium]|nr:ABC transporter ATP-binding protein [Lachnospiraceae bacterium]
MKHLLKEMRGYLKETILAPLFKMLEATFELFVPLVMRDIIDKGIPGADTGYIIRMSLVLVLLALIGLVCAITAQWFSAKAATGFATRLRHNIFRHIQTLSFTEIDRLGPSTLITRMTSDVNQIQNGVNLTLRLFMRSPFVVFGAMIMAFTIDVKSALIFAVIIPMLSIVVFGIMLLTRPMYKKVQDRLDRVTGRTRENLTGVRVIRAFGAEEEEERVFGLSNLELEKMQRFVGRLSAVMNPLTFVMINVAVLILIYTGAIRVEIGILTQGAVVALVNYMNQILVELVKLANLIIQMTRAVACGNRVDAILREGTEKEQAVLLDEDAEAESEAAEDTASPYAVEFDHVSMQYGGSPEDALTDISFRVKKGETVGVIGGTGAGKSTLMHLIPGFYPASAGRVLVDGKEARDYDVRVLRKKIGIVLQKAALFSGTVRENLLFGDPDADDAALTEALKKAQALDFIEEKGGLDAHVEQEGRNFSGGQKQRLGIARALVRHPEILILDDSASALDFATDAALRQAIREMEGEMTVFIVSQRTASIMGADQILVLDDGRLAAKGTHAELMESCEIYREIYESQLN